MCGSREQQWSETAAAAAASAMAAVANGVDINPAHVKNATPPTVGKENEREGRSLSCVVAAVMVVMVDLGCIVSMGDPGRVSDEMGWPLGL